MKNDESGSMSPERFAALAAAYGADLRRWPAAEREAARELQARSDLLVRHALSREKALDHRLDSYAVPAPSAALYRAIVAAAPQPALIWTRARLWWSGLGLAGAGLAGALAGAAAIALSAPNVHHQPGWSLDEATAFGDLAVEQDDL
jgi:hypothetical protein